MPTTRFSDPLHLLVLAPDANVVPVRERAWNLAGSARAATLAEALAAEPAPDVVLLHVEAGAVAHAVEELTHAFPRAALVHVPVEDGDAARELAARSGVDDSLDLAALRGKGAGLQLRQALVRRRHGSVHRARGELRFVFDLNANPMWLVERGSGRILAVNKAAVQVYRYPEAEFLELALDDLEAAGGVADAGDSVIDGIRVGARQHCRRDGSVLDVQVAIQDLPLLGPDALVVQARDVTAERKAVRDLEASERRYRALFEHSTAFVCIHDLDGTLLSINAAAARELGRSRGELLGLNLRELVPTDLQVAFDEYLRRVLRRGEAAGYLNLVGPQGRILLWRYHNRVFEDADGRSYVVGHAEDVTRVRAMEAALQASARRLRIIADILPVQVATVDRNGRVVFANESFRLAHPVLDDASGARSIAEVIGAARMARWLPRLERAMSGMREVFEDGDGEPGDGPWQEVTCMPERETPGAPVSAVHLMLRDITEQKQEERRLLHLAHVDSLTGLLNRGGFQERLERALSRSRDQLVPVALFYLDMDRFKQVNDTHGHGVGDALLREFSARLLDKVRLSDVVARLGGDEFVVLMEGVGAEAAAGIAAKLTAALARPFELHAEHLVLHTAATIGVATGSGLRLEGSEFLARADAMLYAAKEAGRGSWRLVELDPDGDPLPAGPASGQGAGG